MAFVNPKIMHLWDIISPFRREIRAIAEVSFSRQMLYAASNRYAKTILEQAVKKDKN
jgi:hypothetical protein